jgi:hypothetical protein
MPPASAVIWLRASTSSPTWRMRSSRTSTSTRIAESDALVRPGSSVDGSAPPAPLRGRGRRGGALHGRDAHVGQELRPGFLQHRADRLDDCLDADVALQPGGLDGGEDLANGVDHGQQHVRCRLVHASPALA